jgi:1,2-diacylglycerol 3-alpha-glucosyltransferase
MPVLNGVSVSILSLVEELRANGHSVHIFTSAHRGHKDTDPNVHRFLSIRLPFAPGYPLAIPPFYPFLREFRKYNFDIVHTHTPFTVGFVGLRWAQSHHLPIVSTYHTLYVKYAHYVPIFPKPYIRYKVAKHTHYYYSRCHHVIVPSEAAKVSLQRHSVKTPISIIPTGNPPITKSEKESVRKELGIRPSEKILLYVGRIAREKNLDVLIEGIYSVLAQQHDTKFIIVGDGPYRKQCQRRVQELGIGDRVKFAGFVPRSEVDKYYAASDVFVFASMTETQGLVVGEAMSHGVPAVAVRGGGASHAITDDVNGYIVGNSSDQIASAVIRILGNPSLLGRLSESARRSVKVWTHEDHYSAVMNVYEQALRSPVPPLSEVTEQTHANSRTH